MLLGAGTGWTYWTATATGQGSAGTDTLTAPADATAAIKTGAPGTVVVTWTASTVDGGAPDSGYHLTRVETGTGDTSPACGTSASHPTTSLTCEDQPHPDGDYRYRVTALHHTWTAVSEPSGAVTVDTTAPDAPSAPDLAAVSDSGPSDIDGVTHDATADFTGTAEAGSTVRLYSGATLIGSGVAMGGTYSITTESALPEGQHTVTAKATDAAGNVSATSAGTDVTVDTVAPTVTVARADGQPAVTNTQSVTFTVTFSEPVTGFTEADLQLTAPAGASVAVTGSETTYTAELSGMTTDGTVTISVGTDAARDLAGNGNTKAPAESSVTRDSTPPDAPAAPRLDAASDTGASSTDRLTNDTTPTFTGTADPGSTVTLYKGDTALGSVVAGLVDGGWSITSSTLADDTHTITVTATDAAGNTSATSDATSITVDTIAPAAPSAPDLVAVSDSGSSSTDNHTNDSTPTFNGSATTGTTVTLYRGATSAGTFAVTAGTYTVTTGPLADGVHTSTARATDTAGNVSLVSAEISVTIDTMAPTAVISNVTYSNGRVTATGTAGYATGDAASVAVVICQQNSWPCSSGNTDYSGTASVSSTNGAWTNTSSNLETCTLMLLCSGPGQIYVRATHTDLAGNIGTSNTVSRNFS